MYGIYARQSVEKKDSISIEMQVELGRSLLPEGERACVYEDRGYTGTNVNRPAFQQMLVEIRAGHLRGIIVYKLDRISRSLNDFAKLSEELERHHVTLISYGEHLDTGSPMGMMLVRMLIMFAEMEQKTISARIRDNYYARAEMKKPLGGAAPYGYHRDWTVNPVEAAIVFSLFQQVLCGKSFDQLAQMLNGKEIHSPKGKKWTGMQVSRMLRNPVYVKSTAEVHAYFQSKGAQLLHPPEEYAAGNGCHSIRKGESDVIAAGSHKGIIDAELWLAVQQALQQRKPSSSAGSGRLSWLQGLVLCGHCGQSCYVRCNGRGYMYFTCRGRRLGSCKGLKALRTENVEKLAEGVLIKEMEQLLEENTALREEQLLRQKEIAQKIAEIREDPDTVEVQLTVLERLYQSRRGKKRAFNNSPVNLWKACSIEQRKAAARLLVKNIIVTEEKYTLILR
ncbi:MAG: recombinase family protein [Ruminococcus sp.]|nr:recombinase family protein [Ruminococcus sp.]